MPIGEAPGGGPATVLGRYRDRPRPSLGCSGARLLADLAWELRRRQGRYGVASLCVGVGQGVATVIERV